MGVASNSQIYFSPYGLEKNSLAPGWSKQFPVSWIHPTLIRYYKTSLGKEGSVPSFIGKIRAIDCSWYKKPIAMGVSPNSCPRIYDEFKACIDRILKIYRWQPWKRSFVSFLDELEWRCDADECISFRIRFKFIGQLLTLLHQQTTKNQGE